MGTTAARCSRNKLASTGASQSTRSSCLLGLIALDRFQARHIPNPTPIFESANMLVHACRSIHAPASTVSLCSAPPLQGAALDQGALPSSGQPVAGAAHACAPPGRALHLRAGAPVWSQAQPPWEAAQRCSATCPLLHTLAGWALPFRHKEGVMALVELLFFFKGLSMRT